MRTGRYWAPTTSPSTADDRPPAQGPTRADLRVRPAPESRDVVDLASSYGLFIDGEFVDPVDGGRSRRSTRRPRRSSPRSPRRRRPTSTAPSRPAAPTTACGRRCRGRARQVPVPHRADHPGARRELAVLETLDNGKPIKETRDVDVPLVAAHFFYHAGWADKLEYAGSAPRGRSASPGRSSRGTSRCSCWRGRSPRRSRAGNTVVLKPAETTPLTALLFAEICQQADLPPASSTSSPARARPARRSSTTRRRQGRLHRLDRGRQGDRGGRRHRQAVTLELGGKAANIVFDDAPIDQAVEGIVNGIFFNQGHVCCAGLAPARAGERRTTRSSTGSSAGWRRCASATRWTRTPTSARSTPPSSSSDHRARAGRRGRGRRALDQPACDLPDRGYWFPPTVFTGVSQATDRPRGDLRPGAVGADLPHPDEAVEKANNTPYGLSAGVWTEKGSRILWMADQLRAGVVWANTFNRFDPTSARSAATRSPATAARAAATASPPTSTTERS
jgi:aldehyde dehydrogenase (NAD+)